MFKTDRTKKQDLHFLIAFSVTYFQGQSTLIATFFCYQPFFQGSINYQVQHQGVIKQKAGQNK